MIDLNFLIAMLLLRSRNGGESGGVVAQVKTITPPFSGTAECSAG